MLTTTTISYSYNYFDFLDGGRKKRHHLVSADLHHCGGREGQNMEDCVNKLGHFNFRVQCKYRTAHCLYVVKCTHVGSLSVPKFLCEKIVHHINIKTLCCDGICWFTLNYIFERREINSFFFYLRCTMILCSPFKTRK